MTKLTETFRFVLVIDCVFGAECDHEDEHYTGLTKVFWK